MTNWPRRTAIRSTRTSTSPHVLRAQCNLITIDVDDYCRFHFVERDEPDIRQYFNDNLFVYLPLSLRCQPALPSVTGYIFVERRRKNERHIESQQINSFSHLLVGNALRETTKLMIYADKLIYFSLRSFKKPKILKAIWLFFEYLWIFFFGSKLLSFWSTVGASHHLFVVHVICHRHRWDCFCRGKSDKKIGQFLRF